MDIAIHTTELEETRVDGTRVYLSELLKRFYRLSPDDTFFLFHKRPFQRQYALPQTPLYRDKRLAPMPLWTQIRFAHALFQKPPDVLWMPLHNMPRIRSRKTKTVVTIHDLAFLDYPEMFVNADVRKLRLHTDFVVAHADHLIAVSHATKKQLLTHYPQRPEQSITVIHHGFDIDAWDARSYSGDKNLFQKYVITEPYLIYTGAIQPRKNLITLIEAFEHVKKDVPNLQLVLCGGDAWMATQTHRRAEESVFSSDIIFTGRVSFEQMKALLSGAAVFVHPGREEGFGMTVLEAFACGVPVLVANSGSLMEIAGDGAEYFAPQDTKKLATEIKRLLDDKEHAQNLVAHGTKQLTKYSWDTCAQKTLDVFHRL